MSLSYANPVSVGDDGARQVRSRDQLALNSQTTEPNQAPLRAELIGSDRCTGAGITATGYTPVLILCRQLLAAGLDPDTAMSVYRGSTLSLEITSIGIAASVEIAADGVGFRALRKPDAGPLVRKTDGGEL